ncbi:hypothetical protein AAG570_010609 [Ranatra chinensis]|uniref:Uncharacterized protein n=1 Tax=Ranatra chinensis TaxID=642074 RepID=A0ABD0YZ09_9HEMI
MCRINNSKLPQRMRIVDSYDHKAFCDRCIRVYDSSNGRDFPEIYQIQGRDVGWSVLDTAFTPDGRHIAYSSWSPCLHLVELNGDCSSHVALPLCPEERRFCIFSLVFSSDGHEILCGANDRHLYIYDRGANDRTLRVEGHDGDVNTVAFADDTSQIIYSGGDDGFCKVWDRRTLNEASPKPVGVLAGHMDGITYIDSRGDARYLLSNSKDQSIKLWDIRMFSTQDVTRRTLGGHKWDYRWQKVPKKLVNRKTNMKGDTSVATYRGHSVLQTLIRCHFSPAFSTGQRYIYTGCAYGRVIIYDMLTGSIVSKLQGHTSCVRDVSWHPFRPEIISTSVSHKHRLFTSDSF